LGERRWTVANANVKKQKEEKKGLRRGKKKWSSNGVFPGNTERPAMGSSKGRKKRSRATKLGHHLSEKTAQTGSKGTPKLKKGELTTQHGVIARNQLVPVKKTPKNIPQ